MNSNDERIRELDAALVRAARGIGILGPLAWSPALADRFLAAWRAGRPELPAPVYGGLDVAERQAAVRDVMHRCDRSDPRGDFLYRTARSYDVAAAMIASRGRPEFGRLSVELYGSPKEPVSWDRTSTVEAARRLLAATEAMGRRCGHEEADFCVTAEHVAERIREAARVFQGEAIEVVVDPELTAKAAAGARRIRIRGGTRFSEEDVDQLIQHELLVHSLTALNGQAQPNLTALELGAPRTTRTQEGLALFAELVTGSIDLARLRRIAARVVAIDMGLAGADFIEVFRYFLETGQTEQESFASAQRVFRGGDPRGGVVFTKDGVYLQGFVRVHQFLRDAILAGAHDHTRRLFVGRLRAVDVARLEEAFESGWIQPPRFEPPWLKRHTTLAAFLLHSAFTTELHLDSARDRSEERGASDLR